MNRKNLQDLALLRIKEAKALIDSNHSDGAYYLCGYGIECALKACIAKSTLQYDFPDKRRVNESYTHTLTKLVGVAGLQRSLDDEIKKKKKFEVNWAIVKDWSEESRYNRKSMKETSDLYTAVTSRKYGILTWIKKHW